MEYVIRVLRHNKNTSTSYWQEFLFEGSKDTSVATVLRELNARTPLLDRLGKEAKTISWECGCMVRKCGACAMKINGLPRLACSTFLRELKGKKIELEPLSKFPKVEDLVVDRSAVFEKLKETQIWLEQDAVMSKYTKEKRYQSARCLMCGCCLEICPNFSVEGTFAGAILPVNGYRIFEEEQESKHEQEVEERYQTQFFEGCGKSLSCQNICPAKIPVEELMVRSNAAAIWKK